MPTIMATPSSSRNTSKTFLREPSAASTCQPRDYIQLISHRFSALPTGRHMNIRVIPYGGHLSCIALWDPKDDLLTSLLYLCTNFQSIEQTQMTRAVSTDNQANLPKSTPSSFNTADLPEEVYFQLSETMLGALKQAVEKRAAEPIFGLPSKKMKAGSLVETLDQMNGMMFEYGVNTAEEEINLLPKLTEERRPVVEEERGRLFLEKKPLQEKLMKSANKWGVSFVNEDVELCLSLSLEEWFRSILIRLIRYSDQRQNMVIGNPKVLVPSDVGAQIRMLRQKAKELAEQKLKMGEIEADKKQACKNKKKAKGNATNVIASRTSETEEMLHKWEIMAEQARLKRESEAGTVGTFADENKAIGLCSLQKKSELGTSTAHSGRPPGITSQAHPQKCITLNDLISVLEMDPHMAKSTLLYQFYNRVHTKLQQK